MFKKLIVICCLLFFSTVLMAKKQALLVGVGDYKSNESDLNGIDKDIEKMQKLFESWGFEVKILYNKNSLKLEDSLKNYGENLKNSDTFALYYSGHGSFKKDKNGDEMDDQDESLVLSDGVKNTHFLDDEMHYYMNKIKAKKLLIFDSCHSGTVHKSGAKMRARSMPSNLVDGVSSRAVRLRQKEKYRGEYIVLSAAKDNEEALGTSEGGLFTQGLYRLFSKAENRNKSLKSILKKLTYEIASHCKLSDSTPYHPNISISNSKLKDISVRGFLVVNSQEPEVEIEEDLQTKLDNLASDEQINQIIIGNKKASFNSYELVDFTIETNAHKGYLMILYVDKNDVTVLYPNPKIESKPIKGKYKFPEDFGDLKIEAYKSCKNCEREETSIYLLLTPKPFVDMEQNTRTKLLSFAKKSLDAKVVSKAVRIAKERQQKGEKIFIGKYEFVVY